MKIDITGKQVDLTDALRERVHSQVTKAFEHLVEQPARCHVILSHVRHNHTAEIVAHHLGRDFAAEATAPADMYAAIDAAAGKLRRQLDTTAGRDRARRRSGTGNHD
ncbi:MAG: ribosome-associated translation inhibitor RaiA [Betaproteobacteria bacterium]|nr:ribosome-associated translation inhibitor RaiA [Betaproteobacteria bacterium]